MVFAVSSSPAVTFLFIAATVIPVMFLVHALPPTPPPKGPSEEREEERHGLLGGDDSHSRPSRGQPASATQARLGERGGGAQPSGGGTGGPVQGWRMVFILFALCVSLCCITGDEHAVATWLAPMGVEDKISENTMALMSSGFWAAVLAGRVAWFFLAGRISGGSWHVLVVDLTLMLLGGCILLHAVGAAKAGHDPEPSLWAGSMTLGLGASSGLPCVLTLPAEAGLAVGPTGLLALNSAGSLGELAFPYAAGLAFDWGHKQALSGMVIASMLGTLALVLPAAMLARRMRPSPSSQQAAQSSA